MKKVLFFIGVIFLLLFTSDVYAREVHIYLFYGDTCPICENLREYLKIYKDDKEIKIHEFEVYRSTANSNYLQDIKKMYDISQDGVPFMVIGDKAILGYNNSREKRIEKYINTYKEEDYYDRVGVYLGLYEDEEIVDDLDISTSSFNNNSPLDDEKTKISWKFIVGISAFVLLIIIFILQFLSSNKKNGRIKL